NSSSFVICELSSEVEAFLDQLELLELMNVTPTETEAWDIVQMEEIERELLDGE
ncbi:MAG: anti-anti-sigma factor, partial [Chitinophagaceae bacterium]